MRNILLSNFIIDSSLDISYNTILGEGGIGLNSLEYLHFLTLVERFFSISIQDDYWDYKRLSNLEQLVDYIGEKLP